MQPNKPFALVVHGHFYQPPRENPWTEEVPREPSAAPFHDWNERIASECYRPNAFAWIVDDQGRAVAIVDNYRHLSFDVGPTLTSWLEVHAREAHDRIVEAGAGAIAQAYFHVILPLASPRDIRTQVRWGLTEFAHRFGREARGIWLPETAVNDAVLEALVDEGVAFTILAPGQAARVRCLDEDAGDAGEWRDVSGGRVATQRPYRWLHPDRSGRGIDVVFYDGSLSHAIAFELPTLSSQALIDRIEAAGQHGGLVVLAADGESFGHHHTYGDRLLAYALAVEAPRRGVPVTTVEAYLDEHRPSWQAEVHESAWSCAHGVGRWREDCGCETGAGPGWNQRWRAPLRDALDLLRAASDAAWQARSSGVLRNPDRALREYVRVLIGAETKDEFARDHVLGNDVEAFTLLEAERHAMAMYTSCGWFFNDVAGLETVQILRYAARLIDLLRELGEDPPEADFLEILAKAESNRADEGTGRDIWERHVLPERVDPSRVVAHVALVELLEGTPPPTRVAAYDVEVHDHSHQDRGGVALCSGVATLVHRRTGHRTEHAYAALHLGGLEVVGAIRPADPSRDFDALGELWRSFTAGAPVTRLLRIVGEHFGPGEFDLQSALPGKAEELLESAAAALAARFTDAYERLFSDHRSTLVALATAGYPLPPVLRAPAELSLARRFEAEVEAQGGSWDPIAYRAAIEIAREAEAGGFRIDTPAARATLERMLLGAVERAVAGGTDTGGAVEAALGLLQLARDLGVHPDIERAQELVYDALVGASPTPALTLLAVGLHLAVERLGDPR